MHVVERVAGHYNVGEVEFGKVYKWVPANARIECDCGQSFTVKDATAVLARDAALSIRESLRGWGTSY
jgi:hypothetical protein